MNASALYTHVLATLALRRQLLIGGHAVLANDKPQERVNRWLAAQEAFQHVLAVAGGARLEDVPTVVEAQQRVEALVG